MFFETLKELLKLVNSNKGKFIFGILSNWYLYVMAGGISAAYYVLKALKDTGILDRVQNFIFPILDNCVNIAKDCTPKILNLQELYKCLQVWDLVI